MAGRSDPTRTRLSRRIILDAALELVDRTGPEGLSMRRVAEELDVTAMSLYGHVRGREDLLDGLTGLLLEQLEDDLDPADEPMVVLRGFADGIRAAGLGHPAAFSLIGMRPLRAQTALGSVDTALGALRRLGFADDQVVPAYRTVASFARGFTLAEISGFSLADASEAFEGYDTIRDLAPALRRRDADAAFAFGVGAILDGLALRVR